LGEREGEREGQMLLRDWLWFEPFVVRKIEGEEMGRKRRRRREHQEKGEVSLREASLELTFFVSQRPKKEKDKISALRFMQSINDLRRSLLGFRSFKSCWINLSSGQGIAREKNKSPQQLYWNFVTFVSAAASASLLVPSSHAHVFQRIALIGFPSQDWRGLVRRKRGVEGREGEGSAHLG
jgi:hypothetical protein